MRRIALVLLFLTAIVPAVLAQDEVPAEKKQYIYQWTDSKGVVHITDGLGKVPKEYRDRAVKIEQPADGDRGPADEASHPDYRPAPSRSDDERQKYIWRQRMRVVNQRIADAEARYRELETRRNELRSAGVAAATGHLADRSEADRLERDMQGVQKELDEARRERDEVIPDEARKAGVPPGWLRE